MVDPKDVKFIEPTAEEMVILLPMGKDVDIGQKCPECPALHCCDAICFRFSPKVYQCKGCGQYQKHRKIQKLLEGCRADRGLRN